MGSIGCKCCSEREDEGPKLAKDLKILAKVHGQESKAEADPNAMIITFTDSEGMEAEMCVQALRTYLDLKTVKRLRHIQAFEAAALSRLSAEAAAVRNKQGPYQFKEGRPMFPSTMTVSQGVDYVGDLSVAESKPNGRGILVSSDGSISEGYWLSGKLHGKARQIQANGDWYIGDWQAGLMDGRGKQQYSDGHCYEGEWQAGLQHGKGVETWADGASFSGLFQEGQKHGAGIFYWSDGSKYEGELRRNQLEGRGTYLWGDGKRYEGDWKANKMHGFGTFAWPDGKKYEGMYEADQKNGFGTFTWADGRKYEGGWLNNKRHGKGVEYLKGIPFEGVWDNGKKIDSS